MIKTGQNTLKTRETLQVGDKKYAYYSLPKAAESIGDISRLPFSLKVLLENLLRFEDGRTVSVDDIKAFPQWLKDKTSQREIAYRPARVLMQDFTGVPAVVDLAAMREAMVAMGGDAEKINPLSPVDLVIDHSVMVDSFGKADSYAKNMELEFSRNGERYEFLRWGQSAFSNFRVVPPGMGICHQVNLEHLAKCVWDDADESGEQVAFPDTLVGTDSHTTMVNGLGVLGWGVGGIEAEAAMLGQAISMVIPEVIGFKLSGALQEGITATDLVLRVVEMLRERGVVGKFVEFYGDGLQHLSLADRATIANMAPEYGATCGIFPIDKETLNYLRFTGRPDEVLALTEAYAKAQGMWNDANTEEPIFTDTLHLDLTQVEAALAGPKRPQDRVILSKAASEFQTIAKDNGSAGKQAKVDSADYDLQDGAIVIAAITSCTNTSNPNVLLAAGLLAKKARERGLSVKSWVKTSLAPGSQVVGDYLKAAGLQDDLDALGFNIVGFGCTTCIGNSGPLSQPIADAVQAENLTVAAVLSGNRNFEGRVNPHTKANYLASPPLVVAYALAGNMNINLTADALGQDKDGNDVFLKDIWPSNAEIADALSASLTPDMFRARYSDVFSGTKEWQAIRTPESRIYDWNSGSTYVQKPPFFDDIQPEPAPIGDIKGAQLLALLGDSITTDHISPAGSFAQNTPAGDYLSERQVRPQDFNSFGARRGNHEIMMRGTFANIRIKNTLAEGKEGGFSRYKGEVMPMFDAAMKYKQDGTPLIVIGGKEYGTGSSRDWAAKGTRLLGVRAVIVESFERIHRSNLIGMGILPLQFMGDDNSTALNLDGSEIFDITGLENELKPRMQLDLTIHKDGKSDSIKLLCRIDTEDEADYYRHGGILHYVLRNIAKAA